jgi:hypothetical protein
MSMTFEEFFLKKRIDLKQLAENDAVLFSEFKLHYEQMGPKSFDHTKKYWFNELRHKYPAVRPEKAKETLATEKPVQTATEPALKKQGFSPVFKRKPVAETPIDPLKPPVSADEITPANVEEIVKPAFKPRFIKTPSIIKTDKASETPATNSEKPIEKPAYQPKFKPALAKKDPVAENPEETPAQTPIEKKEGYQPRFKPNMVKDKDNTAPNLPEKAGENTEAAKPDGYKPRFKPSMAKKNDESTTVETPTEPEDTTSSENVKPVYKPRFRPPAKSE